MAKRVTVTDFDQATEASRLTRLHDLAVAATRAYALPADLTVTLINLSENATYAVQAPDGQKWALRVHREGYRTRAEIASELAWLQALRDHKIIQTPAPVAGRDGALVQVVGHQGLTAARFVVLFDWETGSEPGIGEDLTRPFEALGEVAARMHRFTRTWDRPSWFTRPLWNFDTAIGARPHWGRWRDGIGVDADSAALFARAARLIERRLTAYGQSPDRFGLIHCDLRLANLLVQDAAVKVIDFDDCGFSWFLYDAATPVSFYEHEPQVPGLIDAWTQGYRRIQALSAEDEAEIPTFVMMRRLLLVAWIGSHGETDLAQSMGQAYTAGTLGLCDRYLSDFA